MVHSYFAEETLEYTCDRCGHREAKLAHTILHMPRVLIVHVKRYQVQRLDVAKDFRRVEIDKTIDLSKVLDKDKILPKTQRSLDEINMLVFGFDL